MKARLIYSKNYDFTFWGLNRLHPFDGRKFSKAWALVASTYKEKINALLIEPKHPVTDELLLNLHGKDYLTSLNRSVSIAQVIEISLARFIPNKLLQKRLITPIKLGCAGTLLATEAALKDNCIAMNFAGGYHHAFSDHGEGFCFFADAALSILDSREQKLLGANNKVLMIDLDAHRGNGFEAMVAGDISVKNFDMYCFQIYPGLHTGDSDNFPTMIPLKSYTQDADYLDTLETELPRFLNENSDAKLVFYNAGNDILDTDPLGGLSVSFDGIVKRDRFVIDQLQTRAIPTVVMTSGGYTKHSHQLIAELAKTIVDSAS